MLTALKLLLTPFAAALARVPRWLWLVLAGVLMAVAAWCWHGARVQAAVDAALLTERQQQQAQAREALLRAEARTRAAETRAALARWEIDRETTERARQLGADAAAARAAVDRLQHTLATLRRGGGPAPESASPVGGDDAAATLASALGQCSRRYTEVAAAADTLAGQVADWQAYATRVLPEVVEIDRPMAPP